MESNSKLKNVKKILFVGLFFLSVVMNAQATRFVYQVTSTPDATNLSDKKTELAYLDVDGKKSVFYAENRVKRDSVMERMRSTRTFDMSQMENFRSNINYIIEKNYEDQSVKFKDRIGRDNYVYKETQPIEWKILPESVKIGEYKTQKAEADFGGRKWYAWFTMDLPVQDGPYKFNGLPGLVVKAQDEKDEYSFDLMQVKKLNAMPELNQMGQDISLTKEKFQKTYETFRKDPEAFMQNSGGGMRGPGGGGQGGPGGMRGGGNGPDQNRMKEMRERMLKEIKSNNNPIELK